MMTQPEKKASAVEALCQNQRVKNRKEGESNGNSGKYFKQQPML